MARLSADVREDIVKADGVLTQIIDDPELWRRFVDNPSKVMAEVGWHADTSDDNHDRANAFMFAALNNKPLLDLLDQHYREFSPENEEEYHRYFLEGAQNGVLRNHVEYDMAAYRYFIDSPDVVRQAYKLVYENLNEKGLLDRQYSADELSTFVDESVSALIDDKPLAEHPNLESYDDNYGAGNAFFVPAAVEFDIVATVVAPVEVFVPATVALQAPLTRTRYSAELAGSDVANRTLSRLAQLHQDILQRALR